MPNSITWSLTVTLSTEEEEIGKASSLLRPPYLSSLKPPIHGMEMEP